MPIIENTPQRLVLQAGSTTLTLDKGAGTAVMQRKMLLWKLKPLENPLSEFAGTKIDEVVDPASGAEIYNTMLVTRTGAGWVFPASDKKDAEAMTAAVRGFLGVA